MSNEIGTIGIADFISKRMKLLNLRVQIPFCLIFFFALSASAQTYSPVWIAETQAFPAAVCPAPANGWLSVGLLRAGKADELAYWIGDFDSSGTMLWQDFFDTTEGTGFTSVTTAPHGYLIGGYGVDSLFNGWHESDTTPDDAALAFFDTSGTMLWSQCYGGSQSDVLTQVISTHDGGYAFVGTTSSSDGDIHDYKNPATNPMDVWIEKVDSVGRIEWERTYGGSGIDEGIGIAELPDHSYGILASTHSGDGDVSHYFGNYDIWLLRLDSAGNKIWDETFGSYLDDAATGIAASSDGSMLIVGQQNFLDSIGEELPSLWAAKVDSNGRVVWQLDDTLWRNYQPTAMSKTLSGGLLITGGILHSQGLATPFVVQLNGRGMPLTRNTIAIATGSVVVASPFINTIAPAFDGGFVAAGTGENDTNHSEGFLARFTAASLAVNTTPAAGTAFEVFPTPARSSVNIRVASGASGHGVLFNILGEAALRFQIVNGASRLDVSHLPKGIYYIEAFASGQAMSLPVVVQ